MNPVLTVASWEFNRFFKWKDVLSGLVWFVVIGVLSFFGTGWLLSDGTKTATVAVADYGGIHPDSLTVPGVAFVAWSEDVQAEGVLRIRSIHDADLEIPSKRGWADALQSRLSELRRNALLADAGLDGGWYASLEAGAVLTTTYTEAPARPRSASITAAVSVFLLLLAVFMGFAYQFTAITGEKTQRITEQVVSAISAQTWMDGKILGITGICLSHVLMYALLSVGTTGAVVFFTDGSFREAMATLDAGLVAVFLLFSLLGILMWNAFLAGVAATIDDPNSSQRSGLMLLPVLPVLFAFIAVLNPDTPAVAVMSLFPLTSPAVMPARMVLTQVPLWETALALFLLAATAWLFRLAAGRIFRIGMLMHGKEPTITEMWKMMAK